jgi:hypothetical protein
MALTEDTLDLDKLPLGEKVAIVLAYRKAKRAGWTVKQYAEYYGYICNIRASKVTNFARGLCETYPNIFGDGVTDKDLEDCL